MREICSPPVIKLISAIFLISLSIGFCSCQEDVIKPVFDGERAMQLLNRQVDMGPRNPGSTGWDSFQMFMVRFFDSLNIEYRTQPFTYYDYIKDDSLRMVNWIVSLNPDQSTRILIAAHYDCRPRAEHDPILDNREKPIPGANDGASGVAVLLHLAELMVVNRPSIGVDLLFFDGEDYGPPGRTDQYLLGSTYFAKKNRQDYEFGLLLDMIGDSGLSVYREAFSERHAKAINDMVWEKAKFLGLDAFKDSVKFEILDDHIPLITVGIPTIDIIDFDYLYWHTTADTPDKCSAASLEIIGRLVLEVIYDQ